MPGSPRPASACTTALLLSDAAPCPPPPVPCSLFLYDDSYDPQLHPRAGVVAPRAHGAVRLPAVLQLMHWIDWTLIVLYLTWMVWDGIRLTKRSHELEGFFLGGRSLPWWAVGLSVMATQLSAITMIGTTGQGFVDGMRFLQYYYALPVAMVILSVTLVPFFHNARVYTAYEYLERRFDAKTRAFTSLLFLLSRSMSLGVVISAPAVVFAVMLGTSVTSAVLITALPTIVYTMFGGVQAVAWTDVKQMVLIVTGLLAAATILVLSLPPEIGLMDGLRIAGSAGRLQT